jgi:hypothetical protein
LLSDLLELSYESTIVASPLGVAELVEGILEERAEAGAASRGIDAMILAQLAGDRPTTGRETAVGEPDPDAAEEDTTGQALLARAVDADGVTVLELDGEPPRGSPPPVPSDGDAVEPVEPAVTGARRRRVWSIAAAAAAAAFVAGGAVWLDQVTRAADPERLPIATADSSADPGPIASRARLTIKSAPSGAQILLDGVLLDRVTPATVEVSSGEPHIVELRAEDHESWTERELVLGPGENLTTFHRLEPLRAQLEVTTSPSGATVFLDGKRLGETPLVRADLTPGPGRTLRIEKGAHKPVLVEIDLRAEKPLTIERALVRAVRYGRVTIDIDASAAGGWAYVEHDGAWVVDPRDPAKKLSTPTTFRLPVGRQRIRLYNAFTRRSKWVTVKVPERGVGSARFSLAAD